jgi:hypothetical protein
MGAAGKALLKVIGREAPKGGDEEETEEETEEGESHPGKVAAMKDFSDAHKDGDHAKMAEAMGSFLDMHETKSATKYSSPK